MSMKKKFLALALAGAVAMPVVANASNNTGIITGTDSAPRTGQVNITGTVNTSQGTAAAGQISVELPTNMGFVVHADGRLETANSGSYTVTNKGQNPVKLDITNFTDTNPNSGITVHSSADFSTGSGKNRADVKLTLRGNQSDIDLGSFIKGTTTEATVFDRIEGNNATANMTLQGVAGTTSNSTVDNNGANDTFVATFKVTKLTK